MSDMSDDDIRADDADPTYERLRAMLPAYLANIDRAKTYRAADGTQQRLGDLSREQLIDAGMNYDFTDRGWRKLASRPFIRALGDKDPRFAPQTLSPAARRLSVAWRAVALILIIASVGCFGIYLYGNPTGARASGEWAFGALFTFGLAAGAMGRSFTPAPVSDPWVDFVRDTAQQIMLDRLAAAAERRRPHATLASVEEAYEKLKRAWGAYELNRAEYLLEMPLLRDSTVPETRAYQDAILALGDAVDALTPGSPQSHVDHADGLALQAWQAWYAARDHASKITISDRSPVERAALIRLDRLIQRLAHESTPAEENTKILTEIRRCIDQIVTVPVSWTTLRALPELAGRDPLPELPAAPAKEDDTTDQN